MGTGEQASGGDMAGDVPDWTRLSANVLNVDALGLEWAQRLTELNEFVQREVAAYALHGRIGAATVQQRQRPPTLTPGDLPGSWNRVYPALHLDDPDGSYELVLGEQQHASAKTGIASVVPYIRVFTTEEFTAGDYEPSYIFWRTELRLARLVHGGVPLGQDSGFVGEFLGRPATDARRIQSVSEQTNYISWLRRAAAAVGVSWLTPFVPLPLPGRRQS